jgi:hypothetical protein
VRTTILGYELDWLAVDRIGNVGLFSSGGWGPVPAVVAEHFGDVSAAIDSIRGLPVLGECAEAPTGDGDYSFWIDPARKGIFGFDWGPTTDGPFVRLTIPSHPIRIGEVMDPAVRSAAGLVRLMVEFASAQYILRTQIGVLEHTGGQE